MPDADALKARVLDALRTVIDPELRQDLVTAGMISQLAVDGSRVHVNVELTTPACPLRDQIEADVRRAVGEAAPDAELDLEFSARVRAAGGSGAKEAVPGVANLIAVASGKGGVGKSTVAVNVAVALARDGARVGLLDCDIFGPSVPLLLGLPTGPPEARDGRMVPLEVDHGGAPLKVMSMAFFLEDDQPVIWRGPMLHKVIQQFLHEVDWGELDYLLIDLPPGTGDVQLSLSQVVPLTGAVIVTTPQDVALLDVRKAVAMFAKVGVPIVGVVENMASFQCPSCGADHAIFGSGGGARWAEEAELTLLGSVPLDIVVRTGGDAGEPAVARDDGGAAGEALIQVSRNLAGQLSMRAREGGFSVELPVL